MKVLADAQLKLYYFGGRERQIFSATASITQSCQHAASSGWGLTHQLLMSALHAAPEGTSKCLSSNVLLFRSSTTVSSQYYQSFLGPTD